jgi:hypothetical protein
LRRSGQLPPETATTVGAELWADDTLALDELTLELDELGLELESELELDDWLGVTVLGAELLCRLSASAFFRAAARRLASATARWRAAAALLAELPRVPLVTSNAGL